MQSKKLQRAASKLIRSARVRADCQANLCVRTGRAERAGRRVSAGGFDDGSQCQCNFITYQCRSAL